MGGGLSAGFSQRDARFVEPTGRVRDGIRTSPGTGDA